MKKSFRSFKQLHQYLNGNAALADNGLILAEHSPPVTQPIDNSIRSIDEHRRAPQSAMAALLKEHPIPSQPKVGQLIEGTIIATCANCFFVDFGYKTEAWLPRNKSTSDLSVRKTGKFLIRSIDEEQEIILVEYQTAKISEVEKSKQSLAELAKLLEAKEVTEAHVIAIARRKDNGAICGLTAKIADCIAFIPASQLTKGLSPKKVVGTAIPVIVTRITSDRAGRPSIIASNAKAVARSNRNRPHQN